MVGPQHVAAAMNLVVTYHAVDQFAKRWRPSLSRHDAEQELIALAAEAAPTKRKTLCDDATVYVALTSSDERIPLAVRESVIVTVLPPGAWEDDSRQPDAVDQAMLDESQDDARRCWAMVNGVAPPPGSTLPELQSAMQLIEQWRGGRHFRKKTVEDAHRVLGLPFIFNPACTCRGCDAQRVRPSGTLPRT